MNQYNLKKNILIGSERLYWSAYITKAPFIVAIDVEPTILLFHQINIALIRFAHNRDDYQNLRCQSQAEHPSATSMSHDEWVKRLINSKLGSRTRALIQEKATWDWWQKHVCNNSDVQIGVYSKSAQPSINYWHNDDAFRFIKALVDKGNIDVLYVNLSSDNVSLKATKKKIVSWFKKHPSYKIGVFDVSNVVDYW